MADQPASIFGQRRFWAVAGLIVVILIGVGAWLWLTAGRESTDDAQVEAHVVPIAARVPGSVLRVSVSDNQQVDAGTVLVELDPRDYEVAVAKARAELADAEASAVAARSSVPIMSTTASSNVTTAQGSVEQARGGIEQAQKELEAARARMTTAEAKLREAEANATKAARDEDRAVVTQCRRGSESRRQLTNH